MIIKSLDTDNLMKVVQLEKLCFGLDAWSEKLLSEEIGKENKHYFVLTEGEEILGYGGFAKVLDEGHIMNIAVSPLHRRKGIGSYILDLFVAEATNLGINSLTLEVRASNEAARKLYEKSGFVLSGKRTGYYHDKEDGCIYWKYL